MHNSGLRTADELKRLGADGLSGTIKGVGELKAQMIMEYLNANY
jgi:hypothetical protein